MGRTQAQLAALMHEAAHRLLFANRRANDLVGRWLLGYPSFTSTDAYRRVHMAHHRQEFGPDEPDIPLYAGLPDQPARASGASWCATRPDDRASADPRAVRRASGRPTPACAARCGRSCAVQAVLLGAAIVGGVWWVYPVFWVAAVPHRLARHQPTCARSPSTAAWTRRPTAARRRTPSARRGGPARCWSRSTSGGTSPHHVDAGISMRHLPEYHRALSDAGLRHPGARVPRATGRCGGHSAAGTPASRPAST